MRVDTSFDEGVAFLKVFGDVDVATAAELAEAGEKALTNFTGTLRIDMADVTFLDSTGIGALISIRNHAETDKTVVVLDNPSSQIRRLLGIAGLADVFQLAEPAKS